MRSSFVSATIVSVLLSGCISTHTAEPTKPSPVTRHESKSYQTSIAKSESNQESSTVTKQPEAAPVVQPKEYTRCSFSAKCEVNPKLNGETIAFVSGTEPQSFVLETKNFKSIWKPDRQDQGFSILNKGADTIRIVWNDSCLVDPFGLAHKVCGGHTSYINRNGPIPETIIPTGSMVVDNVFPADLIVLGRNGSYVSPMLPDESKDAIASIGKSIKVLLAL